MNDERCSINTLTLVYSITDIDVMTYLKPQYCIVYQMPIEEQKTNTINVDIHNYAD